MSRFVWSCRKLNACKPFVANRFSSTGLVFAASRRPLGGSQVRRFSNNNVDDDNDGDASEFVREFEQLKQTDKPNERTYTFETAPEHENVDHERYQVMSMDAFVDKHIEDHAKVVDAYESGEIGDDDMQELKARFEAQHEMLQREANEILNTPEWKEYHLLSESVVDQINREFVESDGPVTAEALAAVRHATTIAVTEMQAFYRERLAARLEREAAEEQAEADRLAQKSLQAAAASATELNSANAPPASKTSEKKRLPVHDSRHARGSLRRKDPLKYAKAAEELVEHFKKGSSVNQVREKYRGLVSKTDMYLLKRNTIAEMRRRHGAQITESLRNGGTIASLMRQYPWMKRQAILSLREEIERKEN